MNDIIFPTMDQIYGENGVEQLEVFSKYGTKCAITDFAVILGGYVDNNNYSSEGDELKHRTGWYWSASHSNAYSVRVVYCDGNEGWYNPY